MQEKKGCDYSTIAIVGVGLIGGSLALALRRGGHRGPVIGVSRPRSIEEAIRLGAIDEGLPYEKLADAAARSDLVVLASPISAILSHLEELGKAGEALRPGTVISDVGSTKKQILEAADRHLPPKVLFIGGHPLAGSEQRGADSADPFLFENAYYVLTPSAGARGEPTERLARALQTTGARAVILTAEQHDRIAAAISHLPQLLAVSLVNFLEELGENRDHGIRLAAGGFRDMTRIASSPFSIWKDILETNHEEIQNALISFIRSVGSSTARLDATSIADAFERAARTRAEIPRDTKGFIHRLWDLLVQVEDTPGMILKLVRPLSEAGINIQDIEVLKVREGEAGTLRLAFATRAVALEARKILERAGFSPRLRE